MLLRLETVLFICFHKVFLAVAEFGYQYTESDWIEVKLYSIVEECAVIIFDNEKILKIKLNREDAVNPVLSGHSKMYKTKVLMENGSLMKVENIAECFPRGAFCNTFDLH